MATDLAKPYSAANVSQLFKTVYQPYYENAYNSNGPLWSRINKVTKAFGTQIQFPWPQGYKGGVSSGTLGESRPATYSNVVLTHKKVYATTIMARDAIYASMGSDASFIEATSEDIKKTVEADTWNWRHILFNDGTGSLGTINTGGVTDNTGGNYSLVISTATWKESAFEENQIVNVASGTEKFYVVSVTPSTRTVVVQRQSGGVQVPAQGEVVYKQNSRNNDPQGLRGACDAAIGGSLYGITLTRKHTSTSIDASSAGISTALINQLCVQVEKKCGKAPTDCVTSYTQYQFLLDLLEDKKYFPVSVEPSAKNLKGRISWNGIGINTTQGQINVFPDPMCEDDRFYALNLDMIKLYRNPGYGWVNDDIGGKGYLRTYGVDQFEAYIATYGEIFIPPCYQGVIKSLATS